MSKVTFDWHTNSQLDLVELVWRDLQNECSNTSMFQTYEWNSLWWTRYRKLGDRLLIGILKEDEKIHAIFPLFVRTRFTPLGPLRIGQFLGIEEVGPSSMDILASKRGTELLAHDFAKLTSQWQKHADLLDLAPVRSGSNLYKLLGAEAFQSDVEKAPVLLAPGSFDLWMAALGSSTRRDIRRKRSYLSSQANSKITHYDQVDDVARGLKNLAQLNIKRLTQLGKRGAFMLPRFEDFHQNFSKELALQNRAHLFELTVDDKVLSAAVVYATGKTWYAYQTGMDPDYLHLAPGAVLDSHVLEFIFNKTDATCVDMGLGHQEYKLRFGGVPQTAYRLRLPANTWRGFLLKMALSIKGRALQLTHGKNEGVLQPCS